MKCQYANMIAWSSVPQHICKVTKIHFRTSYSGSSTLLIVIWNLIDQGHFYNISQVFFIKIPTLPGNVRLFTSLLQSLKGSNFWSWSQNFQTRAIRNWSSTCTSTTARTRRSSKKNWNVRKSLTRRLRWRRKRNRLARRSAIPPSTLSSPTCPCPTTTGCTRSKSSSMSWKQTGH